MADIESDSMQNSNKSRRGWRFQFSLRTFLIGSTLASLGIWWGVSWYKRPGPDEIKLPGGMSIWVEKQVEKPSPWGQAVLVGAGAYAVTDDHGRVWCRGRFDDGEAVGRWTWFHADGGVALTGPCDKSFRTGKWVARNERGGKTLEVEHDAVDDEIQNSWAGSGGGLTGLSMRAPQSKNPRIYSNRSGPAVERHADGRPSAAGPYASDSREGKWTFWNKDGKKTAEGTYRRGRRHGRWTTFDRSGESRAAYYVQGLEVPDLPEQVSALSKQLDSTDWRVCADAIESLATIGGEAVPAIRKALAHSDSEIVIKALRALAQLGPEASEAAEEVRQIAESAGKSLPTKVEALLALFVLDEAARAETLGKLLKMADLADDEACRVLHLRIAELGSPALSPLAKALDSPDAEFRLAALDVLVCMIWPSNSFGWPYPVLGQDYRAELKTIFEKAEGHADAAISQGAKEALRVLNTPPGWGQQLWLGRQRRQAPICWSLIPVVG